MDKSTRTDHELMFDISHGDVAALECLVQRYQQRVFALAYRMLGDWHDAEDVSQETFIRLYNSAGRYKPDAKLITFLYPIVLNLCRDFRRKSAHMTQSETALDSIADPDNPVSAAVRNENARSVTQAVSALPERQKEALLLHRFDGLSYTEVAQVMGISVSAAESLLVRAYAALRQSLAKIKDI
jgi:RNA polymerase sigma-70 factor (ECF subfamily)